MLVVRYCPRESVCSRWDFSERRCRPDGALFLSQKAPAMFSRFSFGVSSKKTFKPVKGHQGGSKREELHQFTRKTLGRCDFTPPRVCSDISAAVQATASCRTHKDNTSLTSITGLTYLGCARQLPPPWSLIGLVLFLCGFSAAFVNRWRG